MLRDELLKPRSIVIVGGSNDLTKPGGALLRNIISGGYKGSLYILNPFEKTVQGHTSYNDPHSLPESECAIFAVSSSKVIKTAEILATHKKTKAFIVLSAGFGETGAEGKELEARLAAIVNSVSGTLIGPNCTGVILPGFAGTFAGPIPELDHAGADFVSASGAFAVFTLERAIPMGIRFSSVITVGNSAQCGVEDIVRYWDETFDKSGSKLKLLYMEQVRYPSLLIKHATSLVKKGCRIAAVKAGVTEAGARAARSHTGALAGPDTAVDALFRKCGITRCYGREEFIYTAGVLMHGKPSGRNFAVITHAGGAGVMATDALTQCGLNVPEINKKAADRLSAGLFHGSSTSNPVDFLGTGTAVQLGKIIDIIDKECPEIHSSLVIFGSPGLADVTPVYDLLNEKMTSARQPIFPVLPSTMVASDAVRHFTGLGRVFFPDEVMLAKSLAAVLNTGKPFPSPKNSIINSGDIRNIINKSPDGYLSPERVRDILDLSGIPRVREVSVYGVDDIEPAAAFTGLPCVMKVTGPVHKTEAGGLKIGISSVDEAADSYTELMKIEGATGIIMQEMVSGLEIFTGAKRIPAFGHVVLCGIGGIYVEVLSDVSAAIAPVGIDEALDMIRRLKGYELIKGARGKEKVSEEKLAGIIVQVSLLVSAAPGIMELDINPLIGTGERIQSADCRILIERLSLNNKNLPINPHIPHTI